MTSILQTRFLARLGIEHPVIQAPMAGVSTPAMAAAVSAAGGLGSIGIGAASVAAARAMIDDIRALTPRPFGVNVFCHRPATADAAREAAWLARLAPLFAAYDAVPPAALAEIYTSFVADAGMTRMLLETRPPVVSFHFGLPDAAVIDQFRKNNIIMLATATNLEEARRIEAMQLDGIVAQGWEAGGHRGLFDPAAADEKLETITLVRLLVKNCGLPVIAAGGIMNGGQIAAALAAGAVAAQLGTAFINCPESLADAGYRAALARVAAQQGDTAQNTVMTAVISGRPARCLENKFTALGLKVNAADIPAYPIAYDAGKALNAAAKAKGDAGFGAQWAGTGAAQARNMTAKDLVETLVRELAAAQAGPA